MKYPSVALCIVTHNELPILKAILLHEARWVDQVCILDMASDDGTKEFCETWLRPGRDAYLRRPQNTCPELGFAEARNAVAETACADWILCSDANSFMDPAHAHQIKPVLALSRADVVSVSTTLLSRFRECQAHQLEQAMREAQEPNGDRHRVLIRRGVGLDMKGYIHEEPYRGEHNVYKDALNSPLRRFHLHGWGDDRLRSDRYGWMLLRAWKGQPELQKYTNRWWYETYCPEHEELLHQQSEAYERYMQETGKR